MRFLQLLVVGALVATASTVATSQHSGHSPYAGYETRAIKSLSETDLEELRRGGGWGLALPAELNGVPGPAHLLELKDEIPLSREQVSAIETIFAEMQTEAISAGERLISMEQALEAAFVAGDLNEPALRALIDDAEIARSNLRFIHLSRHLSASALLSRDQIDRYNALRGYSANPCLNVPEGHDAEAWRRHNAC